MLKITLNQLIHDFTISQKEALLIYYQTLESAQFSTQPINNYDQYTKIRTLMPPQLEDNAPYHKSGAPVRKHYQANI